MKSFLIPVAAMCLFWLCDGPPPPGVTPHVDYASADLYAAPWPDERLRAADGTVELSGLPNPRRVELVEQITAIVGESDGFGLTSAAYFPMDGAIDPGSLPDLRASMTTDASVFVMDVDPDSSERTTRAPIDVEFLPEATLYAPANLIAALPLQGRPLQPGRLYAAVLTTDVRDAEGAAIAQAESTRALIEGTRPESLSESAFAAHQTALAALDEAGVARDRVAALAVFRTWDPTAELRAAWADVSTRALPVIDDVPLTPIEVYDDYCVYATQVAMPDFQGGEPPYRTTGGGWVYDAAGRLEQQRSEPSTVFLTVPRGAMPAEGFSSVLFVRTGGGGDRPLIDRGPRSVSGGDADVPGTGPAMHFARAGLVGIQVDGPLGGLRNPESWDEQFAVFNINNVVGLRDTIRQSALELMVVSRLVDTVAFDATECAGLSTPAGDSVVSLNADRLALFGHSMGATIGPLAVALEPRFGAAILSGAGASWTANVVYKESPLHIRPLAESILQYTSQRIELVEHDPILNLLQWAGEPADPQVYARYLVDEPSGAPRHVLMFQGILDTYIPPPVANPLTLATGLDLAGGALDERIDRFEPLSPVLDLGGGVAVGLPVSANRGAATAVVVQHDEDPVEDGHEVVFQRAEPAMQYRCFLETWSSSSAPTVVLRDATACE